MKAFRSALRRNVIAVVAVLAIATVIGLGVTRPGPIGTIFASSTASSTSNPHDTRGCDSDRGADRSDGKDEGRVPSHGCPPCPQQVGYGATCDGDNDEDDR